MDVTIVDCGIGNIRSVQRMFEAVDVSAGIVDAPESITDARRLVLPGVGSFDAGMNAINRGWRDALERFATERQAPVLGICLGMQLLCRRSEEGQELGLGWIEADVRRFDTTDFPGLKVPHMGWAPVKATRPNPLVPADEGELRFYHVHSYRAVCDDPADQIAKANYAGDFTTALERGNLMGVQFHPEKSHRFGMALFRRFANLPC